MAADRRDDFERFAVSRGPALRARTAHAREPAPAAALLDRQRRDAP